MLLFGEPTPGDHVSVVRPAGYRHDGIYIGEGTVVHYAGDKTTKAQARVRCATLAEFADGGRVSVRRYAPDRTFPREEIVARAKSQLGQTSYHLIFNNCQHFAAWCVTGARTSDQVEAATATSAVAGTCWAGATVGLAVVESVGYAGRSAPALMSGLKTAGRVVGGGSVAGLVLLAAAPAIGSVGLTAAVLRDRAALPDEERQARAIGRRSAVAAGAAGTAGVVFTVNALGVSGLGGVGITSGLAAVGGAFGGGMAAGIMTLIAGPAILAAAFGYLAYRLAMWWLTPPAAPSLAIA